MIKVSLAEAEGQILGHDITAVDIVKGYKGVAFRRGHVVEKKDLAILERLGKRSIYVWEGTEEEVHEDDAALTLAPLIGGANIRHDLEPREGKITFYATCKGLFEVDVERLERINRRGIPSLPTIHRYFPVQPDKQVAAFRIIPLSCSRQLINELRQELETPLISVRPYRFKTAAILVTGSEVYSGKVTDGFTPRLGRKLSALGIEVIQSQILPDDWIKIGAAIAAALGTCDLILVTGGTSVDPDDVTVSALRQAGVNYPQQGNPIQPGNNLSIGYAGSTVVCAIPASALFFETTAFDVFLPRLAVGDRIDAAEVAGAGHGGLCHFCSVCHYPICPFGRSLS